MKLPKSDTRYSDDKGFFYDTERIVFVQGHPVCSRVLREPVRQWLARTVKRHTAREGDSSRIAHLLGPTSSAALHYHLVFVRLDCYPPPLHAPSLTYHVQAQSVNPREPDRSQIVSSSTDSIKSRAALEARDIPTDRSHQSETGESTALAIRRSISAGLNIPATTPEYTTLFGLDDCLQALAFRR
jgi:hypothetical protein